MNDLYAEGFDEDILSIGSKYQSSQYPDQECELCGSLVKGRTAWYEKRKKKAVLCYSCKKKHDLGLPVDQKEDVQAESVIDSPFYDKDDDQLPF